MQKTFLEENRSPKEVMPEINIFSGTLYHGAKNYFSFSVSHDYGDPETNQTGGSATLGVGLYLTNSFKEAENYSLGRQQNDGKPRVYKVILESCDFLDLREKGGAHSKILANGEIKRILIPKKIIQRWRVFFDQYFESQFKDFTPVENQFVDSQAGHILRRVKIDEKTRVFEKFKEYKEYLAAIANEEAIDLRVMLGTAPAIKNASDFAGNLSFPRWAKVFSIFVMTKLCCDGLIYDEASEYGSGISTSYVVFNLKKIAMVANE